MMANCKSCTHSADYLDPEDKKWKLICVSIHKDNLATVEGEHECVGYKEDTNIIKEMNNGRISSSN